MSTTPLTARQLLVREVAAALGENPTGESLVDLIIRCGWQPRPVPDPNSDYLEGLLANGMHVPIEIRHPAYSRAG